MALSPVLCPRLSRDPRWPELRVGGARATAILCEPVAPDFRSVFHRRLLQPCIQMIGGSGPPASLLASPALSRPLTFAEAQAPERRQADRTTRHVDAAPRWRARSFGQAVPVIHRMAFCGRPAGRARLPSPACEGRPNLLLLLRPKPACVPFSGGISPLSHDLSRPSRCQAVALELTVPRPDPPGVRAQPAAPATRAARRKGSGTPLFPGR